MRLRKTADPHQGRCHRNPGALRKLQQLGRSLTGNDSAPAVNHGPPGVPDEIHHLAQRRVVRVLDRVVSAEMHAGGEHRLGGCQLDVLGDIDQHRAGAAGLGNVERFLYDARDVVHIHDQVVVLHHLRGHAEHVRLLKGALANHRLGHLAGDRHERRRVQIGVRNPGHKVRRTWSGGGHHHPRLARRTGVPFRGKHPALLMARQKSPDLGGPRQRLVHVHRSPAGVRKNGVHALPFQTGHENLGSAHGFSAFGCCSLGGCG